MKITPIEIRKQEFKKSMRGYDAVEVDTFHDMVASEMEKFIEDFETVSKQNTTLTTELKHYKEVEKTLKETLYNVQETTQQSKENSQKEAMLIKKEAQVTAEQMMEKARAEVRSMTEEIRSLKQQKESFIARLKHLLASQIELLDVLSIDDEDKAKIKDKARMVTRTAQSTVPEINMPADVVEKPVPQAAAPASQPSRPSPTPKPSTKAAPPQTKPPEEDGGKNMFRDIFGDNLDVDEVLK